MSMTYKPLSLVLSRTSRDIDNRPPLKVAARLSRDESRNNTVHAETVNRAAASSITVTKPRCIKSYRSDRVAIYNEQLDTFHAYSVTEAISQPGLSFQEAVDWVDERLVLVGNGMTSGNFMVTLGLVLASSAIAILLISASFRFIF